MKNNASVDEKNKILEKNVPDTTIHTDASASKLADFLMRHNDNCDKNRHLSDTYYDKTIKEAYQKLINRVSKYIIKKEDLLFIKKAFELANKAHLEQKRATGEPYIFHPLSVAYILSELELDRNAIVAALLHDVVEDTDITIEAIELEFGKEIAFLVDGVTKLSQFKYKNKEDQQLENFQKMFLAMAEDIRVVIIKLADRLHNMRTLWVFRKEKRQRVAKETIEIYAPLAHRLGIYNIKWELEDLCFHYLYPEDYYDLVSQMRQKRQAREAIVDDTMHVLKEKIDDTDIKATITGRPKHFYSIYKKMKRDHRELSQIYDLYAVRVIVDTIPQCYAVLGIVHSLWKPLPNRFKDYIAVPKPNMYQSLHTTIIGTKGQPVEIQIRTWEMHHVSEYGIAAHWRYKEGDANSSQKFDSKIGWLRRILEWQDTENPKELMNAVKLDVFSDEVFVFTPKGDVINLPKGSTPIDFAYRIHTEVGNRCVGAKVNNKIVPLDTKLKNGDIVSIGTSKTGKPSYDWLNIVGATESKSKIRNWFKRENREENIRRGNELLSSEATKLGYDWKILYTHECVKSTANIYSNSSIDDMLASIGYGGLSPRSVLLKIIDFYEKDLNPDKLSKQKNIKTLTSLKSNTKTKTHSNGILVKGESGLLVRLAKCCNPVPGDPIIGYVTRGRGVSVHCVDCSNALNLFDQGRRIYVEWSNEIASRFLVNIEIISYDRSGLMSEILSVFTELKMSVNTAQVNVDENKVAVMDLGIQVKDLQQLEYIMTKIRRIKSVNSVRRIHSKGRN